MSATVTVGRVSSLDRARTHEEQTRARATFTVGLASSIDRARTHEEQFA